MSDFSDAYNIFQEKLEAEFLFELIDETTKDKIKLRLVEFINDQKSKNLIPAIPYTFNIDCDESRILITPMDEETIKLFKQLV